MATLECTHNADHSEVTENSRGLRVKMDRTALELLDKVVPGDHLTEPEHYEPVGAAIGKHNDLIQQAGVELYHQEDGRAQCALSLIHI